MPKSLYYANLINKVFADKSPEIKWKKATTNYNDSMRCLHRTLTKTKDIYEIKERKNNIVAKRDSTKGEKEIVHNQTI